MRLNGRASVRSFAAAIRTLLHTVFLRQLVGAQPRFAGPAIHHRIAEGFFVSARLQHGAMRQDRAVHPHDIIALAHHHPPPVLLEIILQLDPERTVIPAAIQAAVDFARLENESPPLAQADDFLHPLRISGSCHEEGELATDLHRLTQILIVGRLCQPPPWIQNDP